MNVFADALAWLVSAENYTADGSIPQRIAEHLWFTAVAVGSAALIAVPLGYFIGHTGKGRIWVVGSAGAARALPTFGLLLYLVLVMGVSQRTPAAIIPLVLLAIPPLLAGAYAGIDQIDRSTPDAATAQGMT